MDLDADLCYRALATRDARFDGRFFTAVKSTGIYCRPICPARTPRRANCRFYPSAAAAQAAGFRPCRRCRPESAPGTPAWRGTSATVARALRLISEGALDAGSVDELAARLGVGPRYLRRLFVEQVGAAPMSVAMTRRVHFAKRLLEDTELPVTDIALASGFQHVRRLNEAFRRCFDCTPRDIRRERTTKGVPAKRGVLELRLMYRPPLDWNTMLAYLAPRAIPGVEEIHESAYRRTIAPGNTVGVLEADHDADRRAIRVRVPVDCAPHLADIAQRVRSLFDLSADTMRIAEQLDHDPDLMASHSLDWRVPGCWDRFELAVRAILGQQVTVIGATRLAGRLVEAFGRRVDGAPMWCFPTPASLARTTARSIAAIGIPSARAQTIRALSRAVADGAPILEPAPDLTTAVARLVALPGIGDWTAHYIAMRALGEPDAFPAGDLGLRRALSRGRRPLTDRALRMRAESWRPWRAYAAMRIWTRAARTTRSKETP